jgi:hypothetical protein
MTVIHVNFWNKPESDSRKSESDAQASPQRRAAAIMVNFL